MRPLVRHLFKIFLDAVFPPRCMICRSFYDRPHFSDLDLLEKAGLGKISFQMVMDRYLCPLCLKDFIEVESPKCSICGFMFKSRVGGDHVCGRCIKNPFKFQKARAYGLYERSLRKAIHHLKYHHKTYLAEPLSLLLFSTFIKNWNPETIHMIIPTPLHKGRLKKRGFNQTFQLIKKWPEWFKKSGLDRLSIAIDQEVLFRKKKTKAQVGMGKKERVANIRGVFEVRNRSKIDNKNILLIDDVLTTGATANECAKILIKNGAGNVDVLTLAHTDSHILW